MRLRELKKMEERCIKTLALFLTRRLETLLGLRRLRALIELTLDVCRYLER